MSMDEVFATPELVGVILRWAVRNQSTRLVCTCWRNELKRFARKPRGWRAFVNNCTFLQGNLSNWSFGEACPGRPAGHPGCYFLWQPRCFGGSPRSLFPATPEEANPE